MSDPAVTPYRNDAIRCLEQSRRSADGHKLQHRQFLGAISARTTRIRAEHPWSICWLRLLTHLVTQVSKPDTAPSHICRCRRAVACTPLIFTETGCEGNRLSHGWPGLSAGQTVWGAPRTRRRLRVRTKSERRLPRPDRTCSKLQPKAISHDAREANPIRLV